METVVLDEQNTVEEVKPATYVLPYLGVVVSDTTDFDRALQSGIDNGVLGCSTLSVQWSKAQYHLDMAQRQYSKCVNKVARLNGVRTPSQKIGDKKRSLRSTATAFYESLSTPLLRKQCQLFNIDYDTFEDQESIIAALVEKHIEMSL